MLATLLLTLTTLLSIPTADVEEDRAVGPHFPTIEELVSLYAGQVQPGQAELDVLRAELDGLNQHWEAAHAEFRQQLLQLAQQRLRQLAGTPLENDPVGEGEVLGKLAYRTGGRQGELTLRTGEDPQLDRLVAELDAVGEASREAVRRTFGRLPPSGGAAGQDPTPGTGTGPGASDDCVCEIWSEFEDMPASGCGISYGVLIGMASGRCHSFFCGQGRPCRGPITAFFTVDDLECDEAISVLVSSGFRKYKGWYDETLFDEDGEIISSTTYQDYDVWLNCGGLLEVSFSTDIGTPQEQATYRIVIYCGACDGD